MNRSELKKFVTKVLLEKLDQAPRVQGKLVKKTLSFSGIQKEHVSEGSVAEANQYAVDNNLMFSISEDSHFGGHFNSEMTSYEFHPNPEFYGELMETSMSAREQLSRICGTNDQILTEVDAQTAESLVDFIYTNEVFRKDRTDLVFERIEMTIENKLYDKTQFTKMFEYLIKQASTLYTPEQLKLSESELEYATKLLSRRFFDTRMLPEDVVETETLCGKKSFKTGNAFENMQRIVSGHQMFL
jgi:hypothetical protein